MVVRFITHGCVPLTQILLARTLIGREL